MRLVHCFRAFSNCSSSVHDPVELNARETTKGIMSAGWVVSLCANSSL